MVKLLHACVRKYTKSIVFWVCFALTAVCGIINGYHTRIRFLDGIYEFIQLAIYVIVIVWIAGRENEEGIFRNKIVVGHDKDKIFLSELIVGSMVCGLLFLIHTAIFAALNSYSFTVITSEVVIKIFVDALIIHLVLGAILVVFATLTPHRAMSAILGIAFIFGTFWASSTLDYYLNGVEEYIPKYEEVEEEFTDEQGNRYIETAMVESDEKEKNPEYIGGVYRTALDIVYRALPLSHVLDSVDLTDRFLGIKHYVDYFDEEIKYTKWTKEDFVYTEENSDMLNKNLIYSVILLFAITGIGSVCFKRKEFK